MELKDVQSGAFARPTAWPSTDTLLETLNIGFLSGDATLAQSLQRSITAATAFDSWGHAAQVLSSEDMSVLIVSDEFLTAAPAIKQELWRHPATFALMVVANANRLGADSYWGLRPGTAVVTSPLTQALVDVHLRAAAAFLRRAQVDPGSPSRFGEL
ncbi:MAG: hypothetical protein ACPGUF_02260 [Litorivicinus sp.]